jgi:hypothetical protein
MVGEVVERPIYPKAFATEHGIAGTLGRRMGMEQDVHQSFIRYWRAAGVPVKARLRGKYRQS